MIEALVIGGLLLLVSVLANLAQWESGRDDAEVIDALRALLREERMKNRRYPIVSPVAGAWTDENRMGA